METAIVKEMTFEQRMIEKCKQDIGQLMTDEELKKIVQKSMETVFFHKDEVKDHYGRVTGYKPSLAELMVKDLLNPIVEKQIKTFLKENEEAVLAVIKQETQGGFGQMVIRAFNNQFSHQISQFEYSINQRFNEINGRN